MSDTTEPVTAKWETITREYDKDGNLLKERTTVTTDADVPAVKQAHPMGFHVHPAP